MRYQLKSMFILGALLLMSTLHVLPAHAQTKTQQLDTDKYLCWAASNGNLQQVQMMISLGANTNHFEEGVSALMRASYKGHNKIVELLLDSGSNVNLKNEAGTSALMYAAMDGHSDIVKLLLRRDARVNDRDIFGQTALIQAAISGDTETIKALVDAGADLNIKNTYGMSALGSAKKSGNEAATKILRELGAR